MISFSSNGILINYEKLHNYLLSDESVFQNVSLIDFFETLHILQFSRTSYPKKSKEATSNGNKIFYNFINPNFPPGGDSVADDFYQRPIDITSVNMLKGTKRMMNLHHIGLFQRLINRSCTQDVKLSKLEYARMRINYEFQRRTVLLCKEVDVIEHDINEPQYYKDNEIAGYYGNVSFEALKNGFCNYFPIYQEATANDNTNESSQDIKNDNQQSSSSIHYEQVPILNDASEIIAPSAEVEVFEDKENKRKRKRKPYTKRAAKISKKETEDAISNMQMEFSSIENSNETL